MMGNSIFVKYLWCRRYLYYLILTKILHAYSFCNCNISYNDRNFLANNFWKKNIHLEQEVVTTANFFDKSVNIPVALRPTDSFSFDRLINSSELNSRLYCKPLQTFRVSKKSYECYYLCTLVCVYLHREIKKFHFTVGGNFI